MDKSMFEKILKDPPKDFEAAEAFWDSRAPQFNRNQQNESYGFADTVTAVLEEKKILPGAKVLDVGGGSGRYAIPFASTAQSVTVTDISANMLALTEKNAIKAGLQNVQCQKMEWSNADMKTLGWEKKFDLVFASMCPAVRSIKGLQNMSLASKAYCLINQFIKDTDSLSEYMKETLDIQIGYNPHNDRSSVQAFFNLLWLDGYEPEISYMPFKEENQVSMEEAVAFCSEKYHEVLKKTKTDMEYLLKPLVKENSIHITREKTIAMILWKV